jgi:hypothetical protein
VVEFEFFLSDQQPYGLGQREEIGGPGRAPRYLAVNRPRVAAITMFAASAALAVVASFQRVYTVWESDEAHRASYGVDGWGRLRGAAGTVPPGLHEPRWGVAMCVCAGGLALLAFVVAASAIPALAKRVPDRISTGALGAAIAIAAALAGLLVATWLEIGARTDSVKASVDFRAGFGPRIHYGVPLGPFLWLGAASLAAGVLGVTATALLQRARSAG